jgi:hypothetical protein
LPEAFESLNSVQLDFPTEGATVQSPVTFTGEACTFEANVAWRLYSSDGALVEKGFTMALAGCPTRSPFEFEVTIATPGEYEMRVIEYSMKNGKVRAIDTKTFTVE